MGSVSGAYMVFEDISETSTTPGTLTINGVGGDRPLGLLLEAAVRGHQKRVWFCTGTSARTISWNSTPYSQRLARLSLTSLFPTGGLRCGVG